VCEYGLVRLCLGIGCNLSSRRLDYIIPADYIFNYLPTYHKRHNNDQFKNHTPRDYLQAEPDYLAT